MKIVTAPNSILSQKAIKITRFDDKLKNITTNMIKTLESQTDPEGVGLAANQVGLNLALFIIKPEKTSVPKVFVNAEILEKQNIIETKSIKTKKKRKTRAKLEGCLSIPQVWGTVKRAAKIKVKYQDLEGNKHEEWFMDFPAIIIQHEVDHLNGVLFTQRTLEQNRKLYKETGGELHEIKI